MTFDQLYTELLAAGWEPREAKRVALKLIADARAKTNGDGR